MTTPSRRAVLTGAAAMIPATAAVALPALAGPDPIFAVIEEHGIGYHEWVAALDEEYTLEEQLPKELRQSTLFASELTIVDTDDPRWIACLERYHRGHSRLDDAALAMTNVQPTTLAGVVALLDYIDQYNRGKYCQSESSYSEHEHWPDELIDDDLTNPRGNALKCLGRLGHAQRSSRAAGDRHHGIDHHRPDQPPGSSAGRFAAVPPSQSIVLVSWNGCPS